MFSSRSIVLVVIATIGSALAGKGYTESPAGPYFTRISAIDNDSWKPNANGHVYIESVSSNGKVIGFVQMDNLERNLDNHKTDDCSAENGCGWHIHAGTDCADTDTQGGHYFLEGSGKWDGTDPWVDVGYPSTNKQGSTDIVDFNVNMGPDPHVEGRCFVVHASDGSRIACGVLQPTKLSRKQAIRQMELN